MDFKKKKRGIEGFFQRFQSDQSKFEEYYIEYVVKSINGIDEWDFSKFPAHYQGKTSPLPKSLILNFPKTFTRNQRPAIAELDDFTILNIPELLKKLIIYALLGREHTDGLILERELQLEGDNVAPQLSLEAWQDCFDEISDLYNHLINEFGETGNPLLPDVSLLYNRTFLELSIEQIDNVFEAFHLMLGYSLVYGTFVLVEIGEIIEKFLSSNAPKEDIRNIGLFGAFKKPEYIYSLEDLRYGDLVTRIVNYNVDRGFYDNVEVEEIVSKVDKDSVELLKFLTMVLLYNGLEMNDAETKICQLKEDLELISNDWSVHWELSISIQELLRLNYLERINELHSIRVKINSIFLEKC